ncbi:hypothetical protein [Coleofasciculus sp. H7-2]|uniref:hypothetical protein n=1 Tax=Coleofasciculus sp. H7-2 TaxID=3351545 RepID=UPI003671458F
MTQLSNNRTPRRGRIFPERQLSEEEKARRKALDEAFYQRCRAIFERVRPEFIENYYGWFIVIEPNSEDYIIDPDRDAALIKSRQKFPQGRLIIFCLNETGVCGSI